MYIMQAQAIKGKRKGRHSPNLPAFIDAMATLRIVGADATATGESVSFLMAIYFAREGKTHTPINVGSVTSALSNFRGGKSKIDNAAMNAALTNAHARLKREWSEVATGKDYNQWAYEPQVVDNKRFIVRAFRTEPNDADKATLRKYAESVLAEYPKNPPTW